MDIDRICSVPVDDEVSFANETGAVSGASCRWFVADDGLYIYLSIYLCVYIYIYTCTSMYRWIYINTAIYLSICLSIYLSICLPNYLSICLTIYIYLSMCVCVCVCVCAYVCSVPVDDQVAFSDETGAMSGASCGRLVAHDRLGPRVGVHVKAVEDGGVVANLCTEI